MDENRDLIVIEYFYLPFKVQLTVLPLINNRILPTARDTVKGTKSPSVKAGTRFFSCQTSSKRLKTAENHWASHSSFQTVRSS